MLFWTWFAAVGGWLALVVNLIVNRRELQEFFTRLLAVPGPPTGGRGALLEVVTSETWRDPVRINGELVFGRKPEAGLFALGDRYMSGRHARFRAAGGRLYVADLDSKNRTFVNEQPLTPHRERAMSPGDTVRMGNTVLRLARVE